MDLYVIPTFVLLVWTALHCCALINMLICIELQYPASANTQGSKRTALCQAFKWDVLLKTRSSIATNRSSGKRGSVVPVSGMGWENREKIMLFHIQPLLAEAAEWIKGFSAGDWSRGGPQIQLQRSLTKGLQALCSSVNYPNERPRVAWKRLVSDKLYVTCNDSVSRGEVEVQSKAGFIKLKFMNMLKR